MKFGIGTQAWVLRDGNNYKSFLVIGAKDTFRFLLLPDEVRSYEPHSTVGRFHLKNFNVAEEYLGMKIFYAKVTELRYFGAVCFRCGTQFDYLESSTFKCWRCP